MKNLNQFQRFDFAGFATGKRFQCVGCEERKDYSTKEVLGTKVNAVIVVDNTIYAHKDGDNSSNLFERISFKIPKKGVVVPQKSLVEPVNPVATIYGDYRNQLSVKTNDVKIIQPQQQRV
ncbi:MAG: hypothetical protein LUE16_11810 [Lachnospiraceae bacterium]|nr:hypothetical protein [Lachnospiraceae bacterium]